MSTNFLFLPPLSKTPPAASQPLSQMTHHKVKRFVVFTVFLSIMMLMFVGIPQAAYAQSNIQTLYDESCAACHATGALNAPKKGDKARWQQLKSQKGMPALVKSVKEGMTQMPAGGLCSSCNDEQYRQLIDYMSQ